MRSAIATLLLLLCALGSAPASAQQFPALSGRVVDDADIIPPAVEQQLTTKLAALEQQSQRQFVVATIADLQGYPIEDYGYRLGRHWGIGDKERNDGILLIVAPAERRVRIEVGYGLEPVVTDALASSIIDTSILPRFRADDYPGGIVAGADAIIAQLRLPEEEARQVAAKAANDAQDGDEGFPWIFWGFIIFFFVIPFFASRGRRTRRHGRGPVILWGPAIGSGHGGSFGGGWGGSSGGGFSGGGGSFGGGGASGGW